MNLKSLSLHTMYCLKCRKQTADKNPQTSEIKGRPITKAVCAICGTAKQQFTKKSSTQAGRGLVLDAVNLWRRKNCGGRARDLLPGEKHAACYSYIGPGTRIDLPEVRNYPPYDKVDAIGRTHDLAYEKAFAMTDPQAKKDAIRAADTAMISELKKHGKEGTIAAKAIGLKMKLEDSGKVGQQVIKTVVGKDYTGKGHRRRYG